MEFKTRRTQHRAQHRTQHRTQHRAHCTRAHPTACPMGARSTCDMGASQEEFFPVPPVDGRLALTTKCNTGRRFESLTPSEGICKYKEVFAMSHFWNSRDVAIKTPRRARQTLLLTNINDDVAQSRLRLVFEKSHERRPVSPTTSPCSSHVCQPSEG